MRGKEEKNPSLFFFLDISLFVFAYNTSKLLHLGQSIQSNMKLNNLAITPKNSSSDLLSSCSGSGSQSPSKLARQSSIQSTTQKQYNRRPALTGKTNDYLIRNTSSVLSVPLLIDTMNAFHQAADTMEEEIMLPSRLKDLAVDRNIKLLIFFSYLILFFFIELVLDNTVQPDTWHEIYSFVREIRNQLRSTHPFADEDDENDNKEQPKKESSDDEGIVIPNQETTVQFSYTLSETSSEGYEHSSTSSGTASYESIKDELKNHYYGLFRSLDQLASLANRVTERYREEYLS